LGERELEKKLTIHKRLHQLVPVRRHHFRRCQIHFDAGVALLNEHSGPGDPIGLGRGVPGGGREENERSGDFSRSLSKSRGGRKGGELELGRLESSLRRADERTWGLGSRTRYLLTVAAVEECLVVVRVPEVKRPKEERTEGRKERNEVSFVIPFLPFSLLPPL